MQIKKISCLGATPASCALLAGVALRGGDLEMVVADHEGRDPGRWFSHPAISHEPRLRDLLQQALRGPFWLSHKLADAVHDSDVILVSEPTSLASKGLGRARIRQRIVRFHEEMAQFIGQMADGPKLIIEQSQYPGRVAEAMLEVLTMTRPSRGHQIVSIPDFSCPGFLLEELDEPGPLLASIHGNQAGAHTPSDPLATLAAILWPRKSVVAVSDLSDHYPGLAVNAFEAQFRATMATLAAISESNGFSTNDLILEFGERISPRTGLELQQTATTLDLRLHRRTLSQMRYVSHALSQPEAARYWDAALNAVNWSSQHFVAKILKAFQYNLSGRRISIIGGASRSADSAMDRRLVSVCRLLLEEAAQVSIFNPKHPPGVPLPIGAVAWGNHLLEKKFVFEQCSNPGQAARTADAFFILSPLDGVGPIDYESILKEMSNHRVIFDPDCLLDHELLREIGFLVNPGD